MYFVALAVDYDGTIACNEKVSSETIAALVKIKESGRKLILVTGRRLENLKEIFDQLDIFDRIVAENGALIYTPQTEVQHLLAPAPPLDFITKLKAKGISPLACGHVIVATKKPNESTVLEVIRDMGLELKIIFNNNAVMVLPSGINKETGLIEALKELGLSMHNVIAIGDAENDHAFLSAVGLGVAVANANDAIKETADLITTGSCGQGVEELIEELLEDETFLISKTKHQIALSEDIKITPNDRILIAGNSGIGKSTLATALTEKMVANHFQFCIFDPEGDYEQLENAIGVGEVKSTPSLDQVVELLQDPSHNVVVNTLGVDLKERPTFFAELAPKLISLKASTGRPHWLIVDEAHHLMPVAHKSATVALPREGFILITVHPDEVSADALKELDVVIALGPQAPEVLAKISATMKARLPNTPKAPRDDEILIWQRLTNTIKTIKAEKPKQQHKRHTRKYAEGDLSDEFCFYFKGPNNALNLKAQNLIIFLQIAEGIDDGTWMHHLKRKDYSDWFASRIKDSKLAEIASQIENDSTLTPSQSRQAIANLIRELYTAPSSIKD